MSGRADSSFKGEVVEAVLGGGGQAGRQPQSQRERERESEAGGGGAGIINIYMLALKLKAELKHAASLAKASYSRRGRYTQFACVAASTKVHILTRRKAPTQELKASYTSSLRPHTLLA